MASLNKVMLIGNLTRDPELRVTPKGTSICQFGLAVNRQYKDESGASRDDTTFLDIEAWGKQGELVAKYLSKGRPACIVGRLKTESWEDKQSGAKRSKLKVVAEEVQFLGSGERQAGGQGGGRGDDEPTEERREADSIPMQRRSPAPAAAPDDDVPF